MSAKIIQLPVAQKETGRFKFSKRIMDSFARIAEIINNETKAKASNNKRNKK